MTKDELNFYNENKFTIYVRVQEENMINNVIKYIKNIKNIKIVSFENITSFSNLINQCIKDCSSEIMIFCSHRVTPTEDDIYRLISKIDQGYGYVGLFRFACFGIHKNIIKKIGYFDENFVSGYEDDDFRIRLNYSDIGFYEDQSVEYREGPSTWKNNREIEKNYFHKKYTIDSINKTIKINLPDEIDNTIDTSSFLNYKDSIYVKNICSYYGILGPGIHHFKFIE